MTQLMQTNQTPEQIESYLHQVLDNLPLSAVEQDAMIAEVVATAQREIVALGVKPLWTPLPGPQTSAYHHEAFEILYGGAGGGGKSSLLLGIGLTQAKRAILFRREYPQLKDLIIESRQVLSQTPARFNGNLNTWVDIPGDRILEFGACQHEMDVEKYRGRPHDTKLFDELTGFTEFQYRFLIGWTRTTDQNQRTRIVSASNPPSTHDGEWVIRRWAAWLDAKHPNPAEPGEIRWYVVIDGEDVEVDDGASFNHNGETLQPKSRTFIPARLSDNPYLASTGYGAILQNMPEPLRSQLLYGDFSVGAEDDRKQLIPTAWVREAQRRWEQSERPKDLPLSSVGVDVARGGNDKSVIAKRYGHWFDNLVKMRGNETVNGNVLAQRIVDSLAENEKEATIIIDLIGVGSSPYDNLISNDFNVIGYNPSKKSHKTDKSGKLRFANKRSESWWLFREALDPDDGQDLALPPDPELLADLCAPHWELTARGIQVEPKENIVKRLKRSPDCGDAVVMSLEDLTIESYIGFF